MNKVGRAITPAVYGADIGAARDAHHAVVQIVLDGSPINAECAYTLQITKCYWRCFQPNMILRLDVSRCGIPGPSVIGPVQRGYIAV